MIFIKEFSIVEKSIKIERLIFIESILIVEKSTKIERLIFIESLRFIITLAIRYLIV